VRWKGSKGRRPNLGERRGQGMTREERRGVKGVKADALTLERRGEERG
jgi:hypothetical protein